ncbi:MAG: IS66 family transposase [Anaerolineaceae bacterium]|nr:IS66 family transposase [Anaerolineaceae bacterium]
MEGLLQERDELYQELSKLRQADGGALERAEKKNAHYEKVIKEKDFIINKLTDQLAWLRRKLWKPSSEKYIPSDPAQRKLDFEGLDILPEEETVIKASANEIITYKRTRVEREKKKPIRMTLPEHLRREEEIIEPEGIDENWVRIGEEVTEQLEHKPGELYVRRIIRPKYALKKDLQLVHEVSGEEGQDKNIKIAPLPLLPLPRSNAGASLLAELIMSKYIYHLPFHRQLAMFKLEGIKIPASTVNDWFVGCGDLLRALYYRLKEIVLQSDYIQVDESTVPVINNEKHRAVKAYLWVVRAVMKNLVFFHYDKGSRAQRVVIELLHDYKGAVQTDGYDVYSIYENKNGVLLLSCWAHARRKFTEALKEDKTGAEYALEQISLLYGVESMADDQGLDYQQRAELRSRLAYPILLGFEKWIVNYMPKALSDGRMSKALKYTYKLFHRLSRYHLDGRYQMDSNLVENSIRPLALGRKNYMFCGNHDAAENAAIIYSLLGSCAALDVNPREWLTDVLTRIPYYNKDYSLDLADLLPHNWKAGQVLQNAPLEIQ